MADLQNPEFREGRKKSTLGRTFTKTVLVLGTASVIAYSVIKDKLLGNPRSKIRKGLFYATLAGFVLYKCQGDKIEEVYDSAKANLTGAYERFYELKKNTNKELNHLKICNDSLKEEKSELEEKLNKYKLKDSILDEANIKYGLILNEKDSLIKVIEHSVVEKDSLENLIKKQSEKKNNLNISNLNLSETLRTDANYWRKIGEYSNSYSSAVELVQKIDNCGNYYFQICKASSDEGDSAWIISDGKYTIYELAEKYYGSREKAGNIKYKNFNITDATDEQVYPGMPILLEGNLLVNKFKVYRGEIPEFDMFTADCSLTDALNYVYFEDIKKFDAINAIRVYNELYGIDIDKLKEKALISGNKYYAVLIPGFLK